jgi:SAM-dependent methyltransferase
MKKWVNFPGAKGKNVLEIGCGAGTDLAEFARFGAKVTGLDITEAAVNLTKERFKVEKLNGEILQYDGISLPLDDNSYDYIYSWGVLHHTPNIDNLLAEIYRTLKRDGQFIFMLYSSQSLLYYYSILYRAFISGEYQTKSREELLSRYSEFRIDCPYTRAFSIGEIKERLWFFGQIDAEYQYCVYDEASSRKKLAVEPMVVKKTGVADIDLFFEEYNKAVEAHEDLSRFGWHLVGRAIKAK